MAGFKIGEGFVEVTADTDKVLPSVRRAVDDLPDQVGGSADRAGSGIGSRIARGVFNGMAEGSRGGGVFSSVLAVMTSRLAIFAIAGLAAVGIGQQLIGVVGLLPAAGFAAAAGVGALAVGLAHVGDALGETDTPAKLAKVNEALAQLSPSARAAVQEIRGLGPAWTLLRTAVQDALFDRVATTVKELAAAYLPSLRSGLVRTAGGINAVVRSWAGFATAPQTVADTNTMFGNTRGFLDGIAAAIAPFSKALTDIAVVGSGFLPRFGQWLALIAQRFADFVSRARESGQLKAWIQAGLDALRTLWQIVTNVWTAVSNLSSLFAGPLLAALLGVSVVLAAVTGFIREWAHIIFPIAGGILLVVGAMKAWSLAMAGVKIALIAINAIAAMNPFILIAMAVVAVALLIITHWDSVKAFLLAAWGVIKAAAAAVWNWITSTISAAVGAHKAVVLAVWNAVRGFLTGVWNTIRGAAASVWAGITAVIQGAVNNARAVLNWFAGLGGMMRGWWNTAVSAVTSAISTLLGWVGGIPGRIMSTLGNLGSLLASSGRALVDGFLSGIKGAWDRVVGFVRQGVQWVRDLFPFSPAKDGPFSGRGYVSHSGKALTTDFAESLRRGMPGVVAAARDVLGAARFGLDGAPAVATSATGSGIATSAGRTVNVHITQTAGSPAETGRMVALALRGVG